MLDEIEKAHSDVFNTLLQVLDDGRLTDSKGRTVDMRNVVLIMTSNVGARHLMDTTQPWKEREQHVFEALAEAFRPEFLNRVDDRIVFEPLGRDVMSPILEIQLRRVETLLAAKELKLSVTDRAKEAIADAGFDPLYGARPLKRAIQQYLLNPMAKEIVSGGYQPGDRIEVDSEGDEISFSRCAGERESDVA